MFKNVAGQKVAVLAWDTDADAEKTGDAANITAQISKDGAATAASNDVNPTELDAADAPGIYLFDATQAESNCDLFVLFAKSSTANIKLEPVVIHTQPSQQRVNGAVNDGAPSATSFITDLASAVDDFYNDAFLLFIDGALAGQVRNVTDYVGSSKTITVDALTAAPANGDEFVIVNR